MGFKLDRDMFSRKLGIVVGDLVGHVLTTAGAKRATKYLSPDLTVSAVYRGKPGKRATRHHVTLSIGSPNFRERRAIKLFKAAKEPFPVKKIQLDFGAKKRTNKGK